MADRVVPPRVYSSNYVHFNGPIFDLQDRTFQRGNESTHPIVLPHGPFASHNRVHLEVFSLVLRRL